MIQNLWKELLKSFKIEQRVNFLLELKNTILTGIKVCAGWILKIASKVRRKKS